MARNYIGFASSQHDSAIAIVNAAGEVVFAEANERSLKNKRAWNVPPDAMARIGPLVETYCDPDSDLVASLSWSGRGLRWSPWIHRLVRWKERFQRAFSPPEERAAHHYSNQNIRQSMYKAPQGVPDMMLNLEYRLREADGFFSSRRQLHRGGWEHHLCHAATACYTTADTDAISVVIDGMGEGVSVSCYALQGGEIVPLSRKPFLNMASIGLFYGAVCWACGFDPLLGEEWKVMGLASLGQMDPALYEWMRPMVQVRGTELRQSRDHARRLNRLLELRKTWSSPEEAADLAHTGQAIFVELVGELLTGIHQRWGGERLLLGGGCALNSSCNGVLLERTPYRSLHVPMAPGDDGNAIGAALLAWKSDHPRQRPPVCRSPYLGSELSGEAIARVCRLGGLEAEVLSSQDRLVEQVASLLAEGCLVGWVQGRAEFGPRALGNRSILADPRDPAVKDRINQRVKFREEFRPFAPSVLHERGADYFENYQFSPYMERTLRFARTEEVPGVVHRDGTGRLQSVTADLNPRFHALIEAFERKTGVPMLLNTSLNVMGRPIVHDVEDAVALFFTSGLDALVLDDHLFVKRIS
ncbi:MAG: carbamoyltransferase C-terminal domain-containing protein [Planctomycetota bacterium]|nr:carbamoyltransferase C-terminal domain-containing protein [Planctomycetota bacterium]